MPYGVYPLAPLVPGTWYLFLTSKGKLNSSSVSAKVSLIRDLSIGCSLITKNPTSFRLLS